MPDPSRTHVVLIPSYNPGPIVRETVLGALARWQPVWVVVDGSTDGTGALLDELARDHEGLHILHLPANRGKGAAVRHGLRAARQAGFTHALTLDSDGQHPADYIDTYLSVSRRRPGAMVLGRPVFGPEAPPERVHARKICNFWTDFETLWAGLGDSLFGMRVYPIEPTLEILDRIPFARRFDFEPEIAVRLWWAGVHAVPLPTPVRYLTREQGGVSHFHYWRDTLRIIFMHFRLVFFGWLPRLPLLLFRRLGEPTVEELEDAELAHRAP